MAYPYMNGVLHAGHCFTLSKVEFITGFERMRGKNALFPLGFHCTGMPIKACADKLVREIEQFGENFENVPKEDETEVAEPAKPKAKREDISKFTAKKSKAVAKAGRSKYQHEIMLQLGIPREEVKRFAEAEYWLRYFPGLCEKDCTSFGARIDWRRSFITTDVNPYYNRFVEWQMNRLRELGKIKFGERYTIYSAKDGQPCMDHDRQSGEAVVPQEYVNIKIEVLKFTESAENVLSNAKFTQEGKKFYLVASTLRPETMYGQVCCFVSPKITYGIFDAGNDSYYICTERAFKNMSFQKLTPKRGYYKPVVEIKGSELIGSEIHPPLSVYPKVYVLPMETVLASKGTGVVTCVPSDSPDDYITMKELAHKPEYYNIKKEWTDFEIVPVLKTPTYGDVTAKTLVEKFKIRSPRDKDLLAQAKEIAYKEGFYQGVVVIGPYKGSKVEDAKTKVKKDLVDSGAAFIYNEPESLVISRSGDECVVSLEDQWYLDYGEETWRAQVEECLSDLNTFSPETRNGFEGVLGWLKNWALSRSYGLGTKIPWDPKYLVESLSDSTIYMAYYTVCHFLHKDYYGAETGSLGIKPEEMTDEVWDYIFTRRDDITNSPISKEKLDIMRNEFEYFYPLDVRVSGKDLIPNHLTFFMYIHTAIFPKQYWPKGIRANGHLLLNNEKMSKSTGNFYTLKQIVEKFGADAARIALADAGDSFEDANFDESNANAAILRLTTLKTWSEEIIQNIDSYRSGPLESFLDRSFDNEMNQIIEKAYKEYDETNFKAALKYGLFDFQTSRDYYRDSTSDSLGMHKDLILKYIKTQALLIAPVAPHFAEYIYRDVLKNKESIHNAKFPRAETPVDKSLEAALEYVRDLQRSIREAEGLSEKKQKKGHGIQLDTTKPVELTIFISPSFPVWQDEYIELVRGSFDKLSLTFDKDLPKKVSKLGDMRRGMPFVNFLKQRLQKESPEVVFNRKLIFNEIDTIKQVLPLLKRSPPKSTVEKLSVYALKSDNQVAVDIISGEEIEVTAPAKTIEGAVPGNPAVLLKNI